MPACIDTLDKAVRLVEEMALGEVDFADLRMANLRWRGRKSKSATRR
jgi:hypothetical protein